MVGRLAALGALVSLTQAAAPPVNVAAVQAAAATAPVVKVNLATQYQTFDGMGISEAFERGRIIKGADGLSAKNTNLVLDLLFSNTIGAGLTILRNGIGSSPSQPYDHMESIAPVKPATNSTPLSYVSLDSLRGDQQQIWLSKEFLARGGKLIYADAWSADPYMKTNGLDTNGGYICGVTNTSCPTGDWGHAYASKIVKFLQDYESQGIHTDYVGFLNEPDLNTIYASMQSDGQQAADFIEVLAPLIKKAGLKTQIACCDGSGWEQNRPRIAGLIAAGAEDDIGLVTSHGYSSAPGAPFATSKKTWITEWSTFDPFNPAWRTYGSQSDGLTWANHIQSAFSVSNVSAFVYWWGAANDSDNEPLIHIPGNQVVVSKRLWAHAHWGRLVLPGAYRADAAVTNLNGSHLNATAFYSPDGSAAIQVINNGNTSQMITVKGAMNTKTSQVTTWTTNNNNNFTEDVPTLIDGGSIISTIPAYSLVSFYISKK